MNNEIDSKAVVPLNNTFLWKLYQIVDHFTRYEKVQRRRKCAF